MAWADARTLNALRAMHAPPLDALRLYGHLLAAEHVWLARIEGREPETTVSPALDLDECAALGARNHSAFALLIETLSTAELQRPLRYRNSKGDEFVNTRRGRPHSRGASRRVPSRAGGANRARRGRRAAVHRLHLLRPRAELTRVTGAGAADGRDAAGVRVARLEVRCANLLDLVVITIPSLIVSRVLAERARPGRRRRGHGAGVALLPGELRRRSANGYSVGKFVLGIRVVDAARAAAFAVGRRRSAGSCRSASRCRSRSSRSDSSAGSRCGPGPAFAICVPILCVVVVDAYIGGREPSRATARCTTSRPVRTWCGGSTPGPSPQRTSLGRGHAAWMAAPLHVRSRSGSAARIRGRA